MTSRRDLCLSLTAFAALSQFSDATAQQPQQHVDGEAANHAPSGSGTPSGTALLQDNTIFSAGKLPIRNSAIGSSQAVTHGTLPTGEGVELHNSTLLPGHEPHPPHQHEHDEFLFIREGQVDWLIDGTRHPAGPGDILYAASNVLHGMRNTGTTTARYFVLAIGPNLRSA
ncbi:cupin domain-containing protein [Terriglobus sp.]|uniref:cupin domain-containing protein n=1 Tax=Terriglobus sp. TaxID=1889013 RepID=UPI003B001766